MEVDVLGETNVETSKPLEGAFNTFVIVTLIYWFSGYLYMPILTQFVQELGGSLRMVGLVVGSYGFTQMLLRIPLGIYSDWLSKRKAFVSLGVTLIAISSLGLGLATKPWVALIFRSMAGMGAATWVVFTVLFSSYFKPEDVPKAMGIIIFYNKIGQMSGTLLGGFISNSFGQRTPFWIGGILGIGGLILSFRLREQNIVRERMKISDLVSVGKDKTLIQVSVLAILVQAISFSTTFGFTPSLASTMGATDIQLSILMFVASLPAAFASLVSGTIAKWLGEARLIVIAFVLSAITAIAIPFSVNISRLYATQLLLGLANGMVFPVLMGMSIKTVEATKRSTAMGFFQAIYGLGMFAGPVVVGIIADGWGLNIGFFAVGLMGLAGAILGYLFSTKQVKDVKLPGTKFTG